MTGARGEEQRQGDSMSSCCWYRRLWPLWRIGTIALDSQGVVTVRSRVLGSAVFSAPARSISASELGPGDGRRYRLRAGIKGMDVAFDHDGVPDPLSVGVHLCASPRSVVNFFSGSPLFPTGDWQRWKMILIAPQ